MNSVHSSSIMNDDSARQFHLRARVRPDPADRDYLHLHDLLKSLEAVKGRQGLRVLDLGCGDSPYRELFPDGEYRRADIDGEVDYLLADPDAIPSGYFDLVLSTQVLEHVREPLEYLQLARRVLKPGGRLVLTTHGFFEEHACPEDYYRWTAAGLRKLITDAGFQVAACRKVTTRQRAAAYLALRHLSLLGLKRRTLAGCLVAGCNWLAGRLLPLIHAWLDRHCADCIQTEDVVSGHDLYIVLFVEARKP